MRVLAILAAAPFILDGLASAQSFNVDVGTLSPLPAATFGAAAAQPGTWNQVTLVTIGASQPLVDLSGAATAVTMTLTSAGFPYDFYFDNVGTSGDDAALMDDGVDPSDTRAVTFSGLAAGTYDVYTYGWAPDSTAYRTGVSVNGSPVTAVGGTWTGTYSEPVTHALDTVTIAAGQDIVVNLTTVTSFATFNGIQIKSTGSTTTPFCLGDGTGAPCPCAPIPNNGSPGRGCGSAAFPGGALLTSSGVASDETGVGTTDTFELTATDVPGPTLFIQSNGLVSPIAFGDGQLCAFTSLIRLGVVFPGPPNNPANVAKYPGGTTPNEIHIQGLASAGQTKHYQAWYRSVPGICTPGSNYDLTQGLSVVWGP